MDFRLERNKTLIVAGPSHSGKTVFTLKLLKKRHEIFKDAHNINRVIWCYGIYQPKLIQELRQQGFITHQGIIPVADVQEGDIVVLDDLLDESRNSKDVTDMFTRGAHHKDCFIIFIMQNLFPQGKDSRTRSLNTHYYAIFKNPRDKKQFQSFASQVAPGKTKALELAFVNATEKPHGYLFIDLTQECPDKYRYRGNFLEGHFELYQV